MLHGNRWSPDTCECELLFNFEDTLPQEERVHIPVLTQTSHAGETLYTKACGHHQQHLDEHVDKHHAVVLEENQRKNKIENHIIDLFPHHTVKAADSDTRQIKSRYAWKFDDNRTLHIEWGLLSDEEKATLQTHCDTVHGAGKVVIH